MHAPLEDAPLFERRKTIMAKKYAMEATKRDGAGKGIARALRRDGKTPAVIYGDKKEPITITLDQNSANVEYNRGGMFTTLCEMNLDGDKHLVLARDIQLHPVRDTVEHVDFLRVTDKTKISVNVPVHIVGEDTSPGLKAGGVLNIIRFEVELNCSATKIPDFIEADISTKEIGDSIRISDATLPAGTSPVIDDRDFALASIDAPKTLEEEEADQDAADEALAAVGEEGEEGEAAEGDASAEDASE